MARSYQAFRFKQFNIQHNQSIFKVGTDGVLLGAWANIKKPESILDIGCGSGLIAIMCGQRNAKASIIGLEIDTKSADEAKVNAANSPWANRIKIINQSIQDFAKSSIVKFDHIISNPPFFIDGTVSDNQTKAQTRHTQLLPFKDLVLACTKLLNPNGLVSFILPVEEAKILTFLCEQKGLYLNRLCEVRPLLNKAIERWLMEFSLNQTTIKKTELVIQHLGRNNYTNAYKALTGDFYLNM